MLARRTPLLTRTPLRRTRFMRGNRRSKYRRRERDLERMRWTKTRPCMVRELPPFLFMEYAKAVGYKAMTPCEGPIEADHMGARGIGQKAPDDTVVPMCRGHHRERHDHAHTFRPLTREELRAWRARAIELNQAAWSKR